MRPDLVLAGRELADIGRVVDELRRRLAIGARLLIDAGIRQRDEHHVAARIVGALRPVAAAAKGRADVIGLVDVLDHDVLVHGDETLGIDPWRRCSARWSASPTGTRRSPHRSSRRCRSCTGTPVSVLRMPRRASGLIDISPALAAGLTGVLMIIISNVHSWSQLSRGKHLMLPHDFAGLGLDRPARVGAGERSARRSALRFGCGPGAARSVEHEIELGIVGELSPHAGHPALLVRRAGPGFVARLSGTRNQLVAPQLAAGLRVVAGDVAGEARDLARAAGDDDAVRDDRTGGVADEETAAAIGLPHLLAGARVQRDDEIVPGHGEDAIAIERDGALALSVRRGELRGRRQRVAVFPEQIAVRRIDRLDHVARIAEIHDAVVDERRGLVDARLHDARPRELQRLDVGLVDLLKRAVTPGLIVAAMDRASLRASARAASHRSRSRNSAPP